MKHFSAHESRKFRARFRSKEHVPILLR